MDKAVTYVNLLIIIEHLNGQNSNKILSNKLSRIVARNTFLTYLDFNEIFKIHTNASAFQ